MRTPHDSLGLSEPISRRDFLNGALLAGAGFLLPGQAPTISPADAFNGYGGIGDYRHSNGNTWDVLSAGHALRDGAFETRVANAIDTGETYDLGAVARDAAGSLAVRDAEELWLLLRTAVRPATRRMGPGPVGTEARRRSDQ